MGTLETLLAYKQQKESQRNADISSIPSAAVMYQQGQQQKFDNMIKGALTQATLAKSGMRFDQGTNSLISDPSLFPLTSNRLSNLLPKNVYTVDSQGKLTQSGTVSGRDVVKQLPLSPQQIGERSLASREAVTENPTLDDKTKSAIAAMEFLNPRMDSAISALDKIGKDEFEKLLSQGQIQMGQDNAFIVPKGSPLEDLVTEINDAKLTGFGIAGSAYSDTEKNTVESAYSPFGKSYERFRRDLLRNKDFFASRAKAGTMGLSEARKKASKVSAYSAGNSSEEKESNANGLKLGEKFQGKTITKIVMKQKSEKK